MNNSIKLAFVAAFAVIGIAACTSAPTPENNGAPLTFSTPTSTPTSETSPPPVVVTEVVTQTVTNPPKPEAVIKVDNRLGYGALKLGMTLEEARDAGLTDLKWDSDADGACVADSKIAVSRKNGIERITLPLDAKTSKGIGVGSTFGDVKRAYLNASEYRDGLAVKISADAMYEFIGDSGSDANKVISTKLVRSSLDCALAAI